MTKKKVALLGAGGQARETREYAARLGYEVVFWATNREYQDHISQDSTFSTPFIALEDLSAAEKSTPVVCAIGAPGVKHDLLNTYPFETYESIFAHGSYVASDSVIGMGVTLAPNSVVTSRVTIGPHVLINSGATINHDCVIGDFSTIGPGVNVGGNVTIGEGVVIGIGATIKHGVTIGSHTYVGAGAVVLEDVDDHVVTYGVPAIARDKREDWIYEL